MDILGRHIVVFGRHGEVWSANSALCQTKTVKCLRARHFVHEVQIYIYKVWLVRARTDHMAVPNFLGEGLGLRTHRSILPV